jgi:hypothetical protein
MSIDSKGIAKRMYMDMDLLVDVSEGEHQWVFNTLYSLKIGRPPSFRFEIDCCERTIQRI